MNGCHIGVRGGLARRQPAARGERRDQHERGCGEPHRGAAPRASGRFDETTTSAGSLPAKRKAYAPAGTVRRAHPAPRAIVLVEAFAQAVDVDRHRRVVSRHVGLAEHGVGDLGLARGTGVGAARGEEVEQLRAAARSRRNVRGAQARATSASKARAFVSSVRKANPR